MDYRKLLIIGGIVVGVVAILALVAIKNRTGEASHATSRPPELVGQPLPAETFEIDFTKRYDLHCVATAGDHVLVLHRCKIIGSTGPGRHTQVPSPYAELYAQVLPSGRWLVLEMPDGRRAYVPPESIRLIEESESAEEKK
jgi:hypothetical protein